MRSISTHSLVLGLAIASFPLLAACSKSGADAQEQADKAQTTAAEQIRDVNAKAANDTARAQAEADKKIAAAQADFAKTREDYRHSMQSNIDALDKDIANLDARLATTTAPRRDALAAKLADVHTQRQTFGNDFGRLGAVNATAWDATKARVDSEWTDLKRAVDAAK